MNEIAGFYRQSSPTSDLGRYRDQLLGLPADPEALGAIVRGLLIHNDAAKVQGLHWNGSGWVLTDPQTGRSGLTGDDFQDGVTGWKQCRDGASKPAAYGNGELWGWDELRGSLINDVAALNKIEVAGWYWCDRLNVKPLDQPHDELDTSLDTSLDVLARRAGAAESVEQIRGCFDLYPELQPPADAVAR